jgi:Ni/Fe-hydrogenase subunit HybB-like protein
MLLGGDRVHPLWQSPWLPLLYVWAAAFMGFSCVAGTLLFCSLVWNRPIDVEVLDEMAKITGRLIAAWMVFRFADLLIRGKLGLAFQFNIFAGLFWVETLFLIAGGYMLLISARRRDAKLMFYAHLVAAVGGMLYRFNPSTLAFQPRPGAFYFPSAIEILISSGFVSLAIAIFVYAAKVLAILPGSLQMWNDMTKYEKVMQPQTFGLEEEEDACALADD